MLAKALKQMSVLVMVMLFSLVQPDASLSQKEVVLSDPDELITHLVQFNKPFQIQDLLDIAFFHNLRIQEIFFKVGNDVDAIECQNNWDEYDIIEKYISYLENSIIEELKEQAEEPENLNHAQTIDQYEYLLANAVHNFLPVVAVSLEAEPMFWEQISERIFPESFIEKDAAADGSILEVLSQENEYELEELSDQDQYQKNGSQQTFNETSTLTFMEVGGASTSHTFSVSGLSVTGNGSIRLGMKGDFSSNSEYADLYIDNTYIGRHQGGDEDCDSSYDYITFTISKTILQNAAADGHITILVKNSKNVKGCSSSKRKHKVTIQFPYSTGSSTFSETSIKSFSQTGGVSTYHNFYLNGSFIATGNGTLSIGLRGDYGATSEYALIYLDDAYISKHNGGVECGSSYSTITVTIPKTKLISALQDGMIVIRVKNSSAVNSCSYRYHKVTLEFPIGNGNTDPVILSDVPFISQLDASCYPNNLCPYAVTAMQCGYKNDVQPTVAFMKSLAKYATGSQCPKNFSDFSQVSEAARAKCYSPNAYDSFITWQELKNKISSGLPVHVAVRYSYLGNYRCVTSFNGNHSVLVVGFSEANAMWYIHDPLCYQTNGQYRQIPSSIFRPAVEAVSGVSNLFDAITVP